MDKIDRIIAFENGELEEDEVVKLFQELVDSGQAWKLQGHHGRTATELISLGLVKQPKKLTVANDTDSYGNKIWSKKDEE